MENTTVPVGWDLCKLQPFDMSNNATFLLSNSSSKNVKYIVCDYMEAWEHFLPIVCSG